MYDRRTNFDSVVRSFRLSRRSGMRLAGLGAALSVPRRTLTGANAQVASPMTGPDVGCVSDPAANVAIATRWFTDMLNQQQLDIVEEMLDPSVALDPARILRADRRKLGRGERDLAVAAAGLAGG